MRSRLRVRFALLVWASVPALYVQVSTEAGDWFGHRRPAPVATYYRARSAVPPGPLGTFAPTPMLMVRGDSPTGSGYSPLGQSGDVSMSIYGPMSPFRATAAPVVTYARGYDGSVIAVPGTSFSTPNMPGLSSVIYPTQATNFYGPRVLRTPPWWASGVNWIDQN